jgi:hypothetical protein
MLGAIKKYMNDKGHLFPGDALGVERSGSQAWVTEKETGTGIRLFPSEPRARQAIRRALETYDKEG